MGVEGADFTVSFRMTALLACLGVQTVAGETQILKDQDDFCVLNTQSRLY